MLDHELLEAACQYEVLSIKSHLNCMEEFRYISLCDNTLDKLDVQALDVEFTHVQKAAIRQTKHRLVDLVSDYRGVCVDLLPHTDEMIQQQGFNSVVNMLLIDTMEKLHD